jgi:hypothetical protein
MKDVHGQIIAKLEDQSSEVQRLASKALELSADNSESAVVEALKNWVREIVKSKAKAS